MHAGQAYLLAAGHGRRAGGPKAWQVQGGKPLLSRQIDFLAERLIPEQIAVSIQAPWLERCRELHPGVRWVAVDPDATALGAMLSLLRHQPLATWAFLHHVDMPVWEKGLFDALEKHLRESERSGIESIIPSFRGRKGHPIALSPKLQDSLLSLDPGKDRLDLWLHGRRCLVVELDYPCILENRNQPPSDA